MLMNKKMVVFKYYKRNSVIVKVDIVGEWSYFIESFFFEIENMKYYCIFYM